MCFLNLILLILVFTTAGAFCWATVPAWWPPIPMWPFVVAGFLFAPAMALALAVWPEAATWLSVVAALFFLAAMAVLAFILAEE